MKQQLTAEEVNSAREFVMDTIGRLDPNSMDVLQAQVEMTLIAFWGVMIGTFGHQFASGFIEAQLDGLKRGTVVAIQLSPVQSN